MTTMTARVALAETAKMPFYTNVDGERVVDQVGLSFYADYSDERNKEWAKYTPAISVTMTVLPEVAEKFLAGAYTLTFTKDDE